MEHLIYTRHKGLLSTILISAAGFCGTATYAAENDAKFYPQLFNHECLADYSDMGLNCTANDIRVSQVVNIKSVKPNTSPPQPDDSEPPVPVSCRPGDPVTFFADVEIVTTANERYDYAVWLPGGSYSPQEPSTPELTKVCSVLIGDNSGPEPATWIDGLSFEFDVDKKADTQTPLDYCTDISKAAPYTGVHTYYNQLITMTCLDGDSSGKADFNYCMSWNQRAEPGCTDKIPSPAGAPSKCRCDVFDVDITIDPPGIVKSFVSSSASDNSTTLDEPGGDFRFKVEIENSNPNASLYLTELKDYFYFNNAVSYGEVIDLWGTTETPAGDGVYLVENSTSCPKPLPGERYEIKPELTYTCFFTIKVVGDDLPDLPTYGFLAIDDIVKASIENEFELPVPDGDSCPVSLSPVPGDHCSNIKTVTIENVSPSIEVTKSVDLDQLPESNSDTNVTYTVKVENKSTKDAVEITSIVDKVKLNDGQYGTPVDLVGDDDCKVGATLAIGSSCQFTYVTAVKGNALDYITNVVTVDVKDNENDIASDYDDAVVTFSNTPGAIDIIKTATPTTIKEPGGNVTFKFVITNTSAVDYVTLKSLVDDTLFTSNGGVIFDSSGAIDTACDFYDVVLAPDETRDCSIVVPLTGEPSTPHENTATVIGETDDEVDCAEEEIAPCYGKVMDFDDAKVTFIDVPATYSLDANLWFEFSIQIANGSTFEAITLDSFALRDQPVEDGYVARNAENTADLYKVYNSGGSSCPESLPYTIPVNGSLNCLFRVELINPALSGFHLDGGDLKLKLSDNDAVLAEPSFNIKVEMTSP